ncbi:MAG TPA: hypothetical protein VJR89_32250 [Polyangiales bacterium]|nr:hypothetical protein [Polyangiales bacterium]
MSRDLMLKLGTLVDMTRRANPELFQARIEAINPFVGKKFKHHRIAPMLKADLSQFGEIPQRLQREAKALDRRAHVAMLPVVAYLACLGLWFALR